jgi:leader peptidase (prepilin peptidase)/N-methyltransferase
LRDDKRNSPLQVWAGENYAFQETDVPMDLVMTAPLAWFVAGAAVLGAVVGSFLGAALERMPVGRSVVTGRSMCDGCGKALTMPELVPVLSWLIQRGRCRGCGGAIGWWQLACELVGAGLAVVAVLMARDRMMLAAMVMGWQLALLALLDLRHLWLPSRLVGLLAVSGLALSVANAVSVGMPGLVLLSLGGGVLGFGILWLVARVYLKTRGRDGMGGGDPLLLGAIGLWVGPLGVVEVLLGASIVGIGATVAMFAMGRKLAADTPLPLGTCLAVAGWPIFLLQGFG